MSQPLPAFLQKKIDYLGTLCLDSEDLSYLLLRGTVDSREIKTGHSEQSNFGSARYSGDIKVYGAPSVFLGQGMEGTEFGAQRHGEREAFVALIKNSIKKGLGPFGSIKETKMREGGEEAVDDYIQNIPNILKIEELKNEYKEIGEALRNSEKIEIYTEREPCSWCKDYLAELNKLANGKIQVFYSVPQNKAGTELLGIYIGIVKSAKNLFNDKDSDIKKRQREKEALTKYIKNKQSKIVDYQKNLNEVLEKLSKINLTSAEKIDLGNQKEMYVALIKNLKEEVENKKTKFIEERKKINMKILYYFNVKLGEKIKGRQKEFDETAKNLRDFKGDREDDVFIKLQKSYDHQRSILLELDSSLSQINMQAEIDSKKISEDLENFLNPLKQSGQDTKDDLETQNSGISSSASSHTNTSLVENLRKRERNEIEEHSDESDQSPESRGSFLRGWENYRDSFTRDLDVPSKNPSELKNELLDALNDMKTRQDLSVYKLEKSPEEDNVWEVQKTNTSICIGTIRINNEHIQFYHTDNPEDQDHYANLVKKSKYSNLFFLKEKPRFF